MASDSERLGAGETELLEEVDLDLDLDLGGGCCVGVAVGMRTKRNLREGACHVGPNF